MTPISQAFADWKRTPDYAEAFAIDLKKINREKLDAIAFAAFVAGRQSTEPAHDHTP